MHITRDPRIDNAIYWGTFLFAIFVSGYVVTTLITAASNEDSAYSNSAYMRRQSHMATIETTYGIFSIKFLRAQAPITVGNFAELAGAGFYDSTKFHIVKKGQ